MKSITINAVAEISGELTESEVNAVVEAALGQLTGGQAPFNRLVANSTFSGQLIAAADYASGA